MTAAMFRLDPPDHVVVRVDPSNAREPFVLAVPLTVEGAGYRITVPTDFRYDGASVPRWAWPLIPRTDARIFRAATVHDWLYAGRIGTRPMADALFLALMRQDAMPAWKAWLAYLAVRLFGGRAWRT